MQTTRLRVRMREVDPAMMRVIDVPAACTLAELHELLQAAIGRTDSHLHEFQTLDGHRFGVPDEDDAFDDLAPPLADETTTGLRALGAQAVYLYDFGDGWTHDITVLGVGTARPGGVYGEGMCPPEDVGGPDGYAEMLAVLDDPADDQHEHMRAWAGELTDFNQSGTDEQIRRTVGQVPPACGWYSSWPPPASRSPPAGRLPRVFVRAVQTHHPDWAWDERPAMRDDDLLPLATLHDLLRQVGLLRVRHGVLSPTRAATDELQIIRRPRTYMDSDGFSATITGVVVDALAHPWVSPGWGHPDRKPVTQREVELELHRGSAALRALDLIATAAPGELGNPPALRARRAQSSNRARTDHLVTRGKCRRIQHRNTRRIGPHRSKGVTE